jgi:hypothetical protein
MANKRSLIAAVLNVTGASDLFTQDLEDEAGDDDPEPKAPAEDDPRLAETKAERMRSRNSEGERLERNALLGKIKAAADLKGMPEAKRRELWTAHCGTATQETVSLEALGELLGAVHTWTTTTREPDARG